MKLIYFASPMCSWCWGFSPVIERILIEYAEYIKLQLVLTPFRIDSDKPMDKKLRDYVLVQWHKVHEETLQPFDFAFSVPDNFVYNTTLTCHAIKAFTIQKPSNEIEYMSEIQKDFYANNSNITSQSVLVGLAEKFDINLETFCNEIVSVKTKVLLQQDFEYCNSFAISAYPSLVCIQDKKTHKISYGYSSFEVCKRKIDSILTKGYGFIQ